MSSEFGEDSQGEAAEAGWRAMYHLVAEREGQRRIFAAGEATGLTPAVLKALLHLTPEGPCPMRDLADRFRCDPSYVTSLVDGLEEAGLAERRPHPSDRRVKVVVLTDRGVEALAQVRKIIDQPPDWFGALSAKELAQLQGLLAKLQAAQAEEA